MTHDLQREIQTLRSLVNALAGRVAELENPMGRVFVAQKVGDDGEFVERIPNAAADDLQDLEGGRDTTGSAVGSGLLLLSLLNDETAVLGFQNGTNAAYVDLSHRRLEYGKVISIATCNAFVHVNKCRLDGTVLDLIDVSVYPTFGSTADGAADGFAVSVGDVIAYIPLPEDSTQGIQVGAYKSISVGYRCSDTNSTAIAGLNHLSFYNGDFYIGGESDCGGPTNVANIFGRGIMIKAYGGMGGSDCGGPTEDSTAGVKVLNFDSTFSGGRSFGGTASTDARIAFNLFACATTTANVPTIGGAGCVDESLPVEATVLGFLPTQVFVTGITGATAVCNEDGTITVTVNYTTARACVKFT